MNPDTIIIEQARRMAATSPAGIPESRHSRSSACRGEELGRMAHHFDGANSSREADEELSRAQMILEYICWLLAGLIITCLAALALVNGPKIIENVSPAFQAERLNH